MFRRNFWRKYPPHRKTVRHGTKVLPQSFYLVCITPLLGEYISCWKRMISTMVFIQYTKWTSTLCSQYRTHFGVQCSTHPVHKLHKYIMLSHQGIQCAVAQWVLNLQNRELNASVAYSFQQEAMLLSPSSSCRHHRHRFR